MEEGRTDSASFANRHRYLFTLIFERGLFLAFGVIKLIIIIARLQPQDYVEYVSLLGLTAFVATFSKLGIEIYIKLEIPQLIDRVSPRNLFQTLFKLILIPIITLLVFSMGTGIGSKSLGLFPNISSVQITLITILLAINGLVFAILISLKNSSPILYGQLISSLIFVLLYVIYLPQNAGISDFIPLFMLANFIAVIIYIIPIIWIILSSSNENSVSVPPLDFTSVVSKIGISFIFLLSTKIIRVLPISFIDLVSHPAMVSLALIVTLVDVLKEFFNQGVNYLMITSDRVTVNQILPSSYIRGYISLNIILFILTGYAMTNQYLGYLAVRIFGEYGDYLVFALAVFAYPKLILMLSSSINEGYLMRYKRIKEQTLIRFITGCLVVIGIILYLIYFDSFPTLTLYIYLIVAEFLVAFTTGILSFQYFTSSKIFISYLISMLLPLTYIFFLI